MASGGGVTHGARHGPAGPNRHAGSLDPRQAVYAGFSARSTPPTEWERIS